MDIDDTITRHPVFFAFLSNALIAAGHEVLILTFRIDRAGADADLRTWGVVYSELITPSPDPDSWDGTDEWKAQVCRERGVQVLFEDSPEVLRHVDQSVLGLMAVDMGRYDLNRLCGAPPHP